MHPRQIGRLLVANRGELVVRIAPDVPAGRASRSGAGAGGPGTGMVDHRGRRARAAHATYLDVMRCSPRQGRGRRRDSPGLRLPGRERRLRGGRARCRHRLGRAAARGDACIGDKALPDDSRQARGAGSCPATTAMTSGPKLTREAGRSAIRC